MLHDSPTQPLKLYYRIGEVAEIVGVETHVLRYWETEFRSIKPQKSRSGQRVYSRKDVEKLIRVRDLLYTQGFTIAGARKKLQQLGQEPTPSADATLLAVREIKDSLLQLREDIVASMDRLGAATEEQDATLHHEIDNSDSDAGAWGP
jgi:DNA-binding transcriptional MerR regulator